MSLPNIESAFMAVVSTNHLPQEEVDELKTSINNHRVNGMYRTEGYMINTYQSPANFPNLIYLLGYLYGRGFDWVLLDRDADSIEGLPTFEW